MNTSGPELLGILMQPGQDRIQFSEKQHECSSVNRSEYSISKKEDTFMITYLLLDMVDLKPCVKQKRRKSEGGEQEKHQENGGNSRMKLK